MLSDEQLWGARQSAYEPGSRTAFWDAEEGEMDENRAIEAAVRADQIEQLAAVLPGVLDDAESNLHRVQGEWGIGPLPDDDEELLAIQKARALVEAAIRAQLPVTGLDTEKEDGRG